MNNEQRRITMHFDSAWRSEDRFVDLQVSWTVFSKDMKQRYGEYWKYDFLLNGTIERHGKQPALQPIIYLPAGFNGFGYTLDFYTPLKQFDLLKRSNQQSGLLQFYEHEGDEHRGSSGVP